MSLLELRDVVARYGALRALDGVTLAVEDGDFAVLSGSNGAGKTTVLRAISGTVRTSGEISFEGEPLARLPPHARAGRGVAHVVQGRGTFASLSVLDNLRVGAWVRRGSLDNAFVHVYELFPQLYEHRQQRAGALSVVDQQLLALARAIMAKPRLLLVDEPTLGLAPRFTDEVFEVLSQLHRAGTTLLVAGRAPAAATRLFVLEGGRIA